MAKIPPGAKRVFEWVMFDVWQWEQQMFDGSVKTFERISREHTVIVFAVQWEKIALTYQTQPNKHSAWYWDFLWWRLDDGEEPLVWAKRELLEEGGMVSDEWSLVRTYSKSWHIDWDTYYFVARDSSMLQDPQPDEGEKIEIRWVSFDEMVELIKTNQLLDLPLKAELMEMKVDGRLDEFRKLLF